MATSFPPNPSVGQLYTSNGRTWLWTGTQWTAQAVTTPTLSPVYISVSPPANPVQGSLWYDSSNSYLNIWFVDLNGGAWISVTPFPQDTITQQGGTFEGAIYAQYNVPNNPAAFITVGWFNDELTAYLTDNGYMKQGNGVTLNPQGQITSIDSGLIV
jgi:hypothetical protein